MQCSTYLHQQQPLMHVHYTHSTLYFVASLVLNSCALVCKCTQGQDCTVVPLWCVVCCKQSWRLVLRAVQEPSWKLSCGWRCHTVVAAGVFCVWVCCAHIACTACTAHSRPVPPKFSGELYQSIWKHGEGSSGVLWKACICSRPCGGAQAACFAWYLLFLTV